MKTSACEFHELIGCRAEVLDTEKEIHTEKALEKHFALAIKTIKKQKKDERFANAMLENEKLQEKNKGLEMVCLYFQRKRDRSFIVLYYRAWINKQNNSER